MGFMSSSSGGGGDIVDDTSPQLGGNLDTNAHFIDIDDAKGLRDSNGNEHLIFQQVSSAANFVEITNSASGSPVTISANGSDGNISLRLEAKGSSLPVHVNSKFEVANDALVYGATRLAKASVVELNTGGGNTLSWFNQGGSYLHVTAGNVALPNISAKGEQFVILNDSGGQITITKDASDTIVGATTVDDGKAVTVVAVTTSKWFIVG